MLSCVKYCLGAGVLIVELESKYHGLMDEFFKTRGRMRVKINTEKNKIMYLSIDGLSVSEFEI